MLGLALDSLSSTMETTGPFQQVEKECADAKKLVKFARDAFHAERADLQSILGPIEDFTSCSRSETDLLQSELNLESEFRAGSQIRSRSASQIRSSSGSLIRSSSGTSCSF